MQFIYCHSLGGSTVLTSSDLTRERKHTVLTGYTLSFYSASALLAMQSAVLARGILSVCPSVRHVPVLCPDE